MNMNFAPEIKKILVKRGIITSQSEVKKPEVLEHLSRILQISARNEDSRLQSWAIKNALFSPNRQVSSLGDVLVEKGLMNEDYEPLEEGVKELVFLFNEEFRTGDSEYPEYTYLERRQRKSLEEFLSSHEERESKMDSFDGDPFDDDKW